MRIAVKDIPSYPVEVADKLDAKDFDIQDDDVQCVTPVEVRATLERITNALTVKIDAKTRFSFLCSCCAEPFEKDLEKSLSLAYELEPATTHIDLGEDIRQEILIELPVRNLCREDCKGICPSCGVNLNDNKCKCKE